jgi:hypothetical protein
MPVKKKEEEKPVEKKEQPEDNWTDKEGKEYASASEVEEIKGMLQILMNKFGGKNAEEMVNGAIKQNGPVRLSEIGNTRLEPADDNDLFPDAQEREAFMNEFVTIQIADSQDPEDPKVFSISVNGVHQPFVRGVPVAVKRKYIEALARCRPTDFTSSHSTADLVEDAPLNRHDYMSYPFTVIEDKNPLGKEYWPRIRREAH